MAELNRKLVLETGETFYGTGFGATVNTVGELVYNTSMVGYQEIFSNPSFAGQIIVMTYPLIGQYGITDEDFESRSTLLAGLVVRDYCETPSNFRFTKTLSAQLELDGVPCISGLDTRMITRIIRDKNLVKAAIVDINTSTEDALKLIREHNFSKRPVENISCAKKWYKRTPDNKYNVVVLDCGVKHSILEKFNRMGCNLTIVPFNTSAEEILMLKPDGLLISSGPGDPDQLPELLETINALKGKMPICGEDLGHQLIAMSYGAELSIMTPGHHGGRPVRNLEDGSIQNVEHHHFYTVKRESLKDEGVKVIYEDVIDGSVEGLKCEKDKIISCQFYPEGGPGPVMEEFFEQFVKWME